MGCVGSSSNDVKKAKEPNRLDNNTNQYTDLDKNNKIIDEVSIVSDALQISIDNDNTESQYAPYYIYGYNYNTCSSNIFFTADRNFVYNTTSVAVVLDPTTNNQMLFTGKCNKKYNEEIACLNISYDRTKVAIGQKGPKPKVFICNSSTGACLSKYEVKNKDSTGIYICSFFSDGRYLGFVSIDTNNTLHIIQTDSGKSVWKALLGNIKVNACTWGKTEFVTCTENEIRFWNIENRESKNSSTYDERNLQCISFDREGNYYAGKDDGAICVFKESKFYGKIAKAHNSKIIAIVVGSGNIVTAGADERIIVRHKKSEVVKYEIYHPCVPNAIDIINDYLILGDRRGEITLYKSNKSIANWSHHYKEDIQDLIIIDDYMITIGEDNRIIIWDYNQCKSVIVANIYENEKNQENQCASCIAYNKRTEEIAIGTKNGEIHIREFKNIQRDKKRLKESKELINCMKYSSGGYTLVAASEDSNVYIYTVPSYELINSPTTHSSPIIFIDWTEDDKYLRYLCKNSDLLYFDITKMEEDIEGTNNTKNITWSSEDCIINLEISSIKDEESTITAIAKSHDGNILISGNDKGIIKEYMYPLKESDIGTVLR